MSVRRVVQIAASLAVNAYWLFPGNPIPLYTGRLKTVCSPGLNCYSCPAAVTACPIGAIQSALAALGPGIEAGRTQPGLYVLGWLGMIGAAGGRLPCGWLCPFGLLQDLMHKIPSPKFRVPKALTWLKYIFLAVFVVLLPLLATDMFGYGQTWYCKWICPAGTLEAGLPLPLLKPGLRQTLGWLFVHKMAVLALFLIWMVMARRPFCKTACPLGAIYALFNRVSIFRLRVDPAKCVRCGTCEEDCPMDVRVWENPNSPECIRCLKCLNHSCRYGAISWELAGTAPREPGTPKNKTAPPTAGDPA